jgi:predicted nuclease of predicted toxin-antitoxin system
MRILVDENLPVELVRTARAEGIEAQWVRDVI